MKQCTTVKGDNVDEDVHDDDDDNDEEDCDENVKS